MRSPRQRKFSSPVKATDFAVDKGVDLTDLPLPEVFLIGCDMYQIIWRVRIWCPSMGEAQVRNDFFADVMSELHKIKEDMITDLHLRETPSHSDFNL